MRASFTGLFAATILISSAAYAGSPPIPSNALNPTSAIPSAFSNDNKLDNDAQTLAGVEAQPGINPSQAKVNRDHDQIDHLTQQYETDTKLRAPHATLKADNTALKNAQNQLKLDQKACSADMKASGEHLDPRLASSTCR